MLIVVGIAFIVIESLNANRVPRVERLRDLTFKDAFVIGLFQLVAAVLPGTSRSGATILGGLMIGVSRTVAAKFTFILAIPVMAGASLLKIVKSDLSFTAAEWTTLGVGMLVAFIVSFLIIAFLMNYIRKHDFKAFGVYRIILGILVLVYFNFLKAPVY